jgi:hypothetical protein
MSMPEGAPNDSSATRDPVASLDGGTLSIIDNAPDPARERPTASEAKSGSGYVLVRFRQ